MISVVIPLYNKAHTIARTLNSVLQQTFSQFEVIIVDDGSTDNGLEVIRNFSQDPRIRIFTQQNQGVSAARNYGVRVATYDYIAFLDGDDEWRAEYLEVMTKTIKCFSQAGMYCCAGSVRNADGAEVPRIARKYKNRTLEINFFENPHVFLHTSATVVSKSEFMKTGGFPLGMKRNQDFALFFSLALMTKVVYCGYPLSIYVGGVPGQATNTPIDVVLKFVLDRYNITYNVWKNMPAKNKSFIVFMKYELRHLIMVFMIDRKYDAIDFLLTRLNKEIIDLLTGFEPFLYTRKPLRTASIGYVKLTKLRWRLRGYPYVGQRVD